MGSNNAINLANQGVCYYNGTNAFTGIDGVTAGDVLTSNGTGVAPSFQPPVVIGGGGGFLAHLNTNRSNVTGDFTTYTVVFDQIIFDTTGGYNSGNGIFTAPIGGVYNFGGLAIMNNPAGSANQMECSILSSSSPVGAFIGDNFPTLNQLANFSGIGGFINLSGSVVYQLAAGDQVTFNVQGGGGTKTTSVEAGSYFCGSLISGSSSAFSTGSWTPTFFGSTTVGTTTYAIQNGVYSKVGNIVFITGNIQFTAATGTGNAVIGGFPFPVKSTPVVDYYGSISMGNNWVWPATTTSPIFAAIHGGSTGIILSNLNGLYSQIFQMQNISSQILFSVTYITD